MSKSIQKQYSFPILPIMLDSFLPNGIKITITISILDKNILWDCKTFHVVWLFLRKQKMNKCPDLKALCWWFHAALTANLVPFTSQSFTIILTDTVMRFEKLYGSLYLSSVSTFMWWFFLKKGKKSLLLYEWPQWVVGNMTILHINWSELQFAMLCVIVWQYTTVHI